MKEKFIGIINEILKSKQIEGIKLERIELLESVLHNHELFEKMYKQFSDYFTSIFEEDDLYTKTEDFVYRLHYAISKWLIPVHRLSDSEVVNILPNLIDDGLDLYESVSYDDYDKMMLEDFEDIYQRKEHNI